MWGKERDGCDPLLRRMWGGEKGCGQLLRRMWGQEKEERPATTTDLGASYSCGNITPMPDQACSRVVQL